MRFITILAVVSLLALSIAAAIHTEETRSSVEQTTIEQRDILFTQNRLGFDYTKPLGGYGFKGASRGSFGFKGEEESFSNLATNAFLARGRDPKRISNIYSSARGHVIIDQTVQLSPVDAGLVQRPQIVGQATGAVRILSRYEHQIRVPRGTVYLRTRDLPPLGKDEVYEAWLVDEDTGYSHSMGLFTSKGIGRTGTLVWDIQGLLTPYDSIIITKEPYPDTDPNPSEPILIGSLMPQQVVSP